MHYFEIVRVPGQLNPELVICTEEMLGAFRFELNHALRVG